MKGFLATVLVLPLAHTPAAQPALDSRLASASATLVASCAGQPNGTTCDDGNPCTVGEACVTGACLAPIAFSQGGQLVTGGFFNALSDLNGDGNLDLVLTAFTVDGLFVLLGDGAGGFAGTATSPFSGPRDFAVGDLNHDGALDLAITTTGGLVHVLLGDGTGSFSDVSSVDMHGSGPFFSIQLGDWNADGDLDLAVASKNDDEVAVVFGDGLGGFPSAVRVVPVGDAPVSLAVGDVNGDGNPDLVTANEGSDNLTLLPGAHAPGTFIGAGDAPRFVRVADVNHDAKPDLVVANSGSNDVTVLLGDGVGGFTPSAGSPLAVGTTPSYLAITDANGDENLDLAVSYSGSSSVTILLGDGAGRFGQPSGSPWVLDSEPHAIASGDVNHDGKLDLVAATPSGVLLNTRSVAANGTACSDGNACTGSDSCRSGSCVAPVSFSPAPSIVVGSTPLSIAQGDLNRDGRLDLAVANFSSSTASLLLGNGSGGFAASPVSPVSVGTNPFSIAIGDVNRDERADFAVANQGSDDLSLLLGSASGVFNPAAGSPQATGSSPKAVAIGNFNGDTRLDLAIANTGEDDVSVFVTLNSTGALQAAAGSPFAVGRGPDAIAVGDLNGDQKVDLAVANVESNDVTILLGAGTGQFTRFAGPSVRVGHGPDSIAEGDWNGDGKPDLAVANDSSDDVTILLGDGTGRFVEHGASPIPSGDAPSTIAAGDLNGDGKLDLAVANRTSADVTILLGTGSGAFVRPSGSPIAAGGAPFGVVVGDWDADGRPDLAFTDKNQARVRILLNSTSFPAVACNDGNACTLNDHCQVGSCGAGSANSGRPCNDYNSCTRVDTCQAGVCRGTNPAKNGIACNDGNACTLTDTCQSGVCVGGNVAGNGSACGVGGDACTLGKTCQAGICTGGTPAVNGTACDDGNPCTLTDTCQVGHCGGGNPAANGAICQAGDTCTQAGKCQSAACIAGNPFSDGTACDDANACTASDVCTGGGCAGAVPVPAAADDGLRVSRSGASATVTWNFPSGATTSDLLRGLVSGLPVGPGGGDEACMADDVVANSHGDSETPATGDAFWYLVRGSTVCADGPYGTQGLHGAPGAARSSTTCP